MLIKYISDKQQNFFIGFKSLEVIVKCKSWVASLFPNAAWRSWRSYISSLDLKFPFFLKHVSLPRSFSPLLFHSGCSRTSSAMRSSTPRIFGEIKSSLICLLEWTPRILLQPPPPWPWYDFAMIDPILKRWRKKYLDTRNQRHRLRSRHPDLSWQKMPPFQTRSLPFVRNPDTIPQNWSKDRDRLRIYWGSRLCDKDAMQ